MRRALSKGIARRAKECGMEACALTDHGNMHGAVDFYKAAVSEGVKPILGCEVYMAPQSRLEKKRLGPGIRNAYHLVLLAKNAEGYHNLCKLTFEGLFRGILLLSKDRQGAFEGACCWAHLSLSLPLFSGS